MWPSVKTSCRMVPGWQPCVEWEHGFIDCVFSSAPQPRNGCSTAQASSAALVSRPVKESGIPAEEAHAKYGTFQLDYSISALHLSEPP